MRSNAFYEQLGAKMKGIGIIFFFLVTLVSFSQTSDQAPQSPIKIDTKNLVVYVDAAKCRWSAEVKGTAMKMNDVYFLPGDNASGWKIASAVNDNDTGNLGAYTTLTLHGTKQGELDFDYSISVGKTNNDILVSLSRTNNTSQDVDVGDMDYFISTDVRLGGRNEDWVSLGTPANNDEYYERCNVINLINPKMYEVNHVVREMGTGNSLLMGHVTAMKGASRFEVRSGWKRKVPDTMQVRGYCSYKVTVPSGVGFAGEKLLICFNDDALHSMEHQADLIAIAHDVRLKQRRPIILNDQNLYENNYSRFHSFRSGGNTATAEKFFKTNGLFDFCWGLDGPLSQGRLGGYALGGKMMDSPNHAGFPAECFLPINTVKYGNKRVIDFSNPLTVKVEHERALKWVAGNERKTGMTEIDFADYWDSWPGQFDTFKSPLETFRACCMIWREVIDQNAPRMVIRSNYEKIDHSYGTVDICRISADADHGYENVGSYLTGEKFTALFTESVLGSANRFFYNGRVFWNDGDGFHIFKYQKERDSENYNYGQAKVSANFHAIAGNAQYIEEAFDQPYPSDRIELMKRISPPTMDVAYPVDLFLRTPAQVWNMPIERPFGKWSVVAVFNYSKTFKKNKNPIFSTTLNAVKDLRLDPDKEYVVYEFWTKKLVGTFKGKFVTRPVNPYDCDIYSIVEKQDHPILISTSRHIRQMAFDIKNLAYDGKNQTLEGTSRSVAGDPYQLRIYVPEGFTPKRFELTNGLVGTMKTDDSLLTIDYTSSTGVDVGWKVYF